MEKLFKNQRIKVILGIILLFSLSLSNIPVFAQEPSAPNQEVTVYFQKESGQRVDPNEKGEFTLTSLDKGTFKLEPENPSITPYWECKIPMSEGINQWTDIWIQALTGAYQGSTIRTATAKVYDKDPAMADAKVLKEFTINNVQSKIESLTLSVDGKAVDPQNPATLHTKGNAGGKALTVKAKVADSDTLVEVPDTAYQIKCDDQNNGWTQDNGYFGFRDTANVDALTFTIAMKDGSAEASFKAVIEKVEAQDFTVSVPKVAYIADWNQLNGKQYIGITEDKLGENPEKCYTIKFTPEETSNQNVKWKSLTPEIADFQPLHGNGIVPKKSGEAHFKVTSESNPALTRDVKVKFEYKTPLKGMTLTEKSFKLSQYDSLELPLKASPENATEQRYHWSFDKQGIVKIDSTVSRKNLNVSHTTTHTLEALEVGKVKVTGTPFDNTSGAGTITFEVEVIPGSSSQPQDYPKMAQGGVDHGTSILQQQNHNTYRSEWNIFTLSRSGIQIPAEDADSYVDSFVNAMDSSDDYLPATDYERVIIALTSLGIDATDVYGYDLIGTLSNLESIQTDTSNAMIFGLLALDTKPYQTYESAKWDRNALIEKLLGFQNQDGGFRLTSEPGESGIDITAMAVQALAPYYKEMFDPGTVQSINDAYYDRIMTSVDNALDFLSHKMDSKAGYSGNSCSSAQVLTALTSLNIDPVTDKRFTKGDKNLVTNLLSFRKDGGFALNDQSDTVSVFSNTQVTYALTSYIRMTQGLTALYDMSDVSFEGEGGQEGGTGSEDQTAQYKKMVLDMQNKLFSLVYSDLPKEKEKVENARKEFDALYQMLNENEQGKGFAAELKQREYILNGLEGIIAVTTCVDPVDYYEKEQKEIEAIWDEYVPKLREIAEMGEYDETAANLVAQAVSSLKKIKTKAMIDNPGETKPTEPTPTKPAPTEPKPDPSEPGTTPTEPTPDPSQPDTKPTEPAQNPFTDIAPDKYFYEPVLWAVNKGITSGVSPNEFGPSLECTRGQIATFLWAAAGKPEPTSTNNPFTDVSESDYYYKAVLWAVENGITSGMSADKFGPKVTCTRAQAVTFLWAAEGKPIVESAAAFTDVAESAYYYNAVRWAVENKVTAGVGDGMFGPNQDCLRGQIVTFLYKAVG